MSAGKGDKPRPMDRKKYEENYDLIFRKPLQVDDGFIEQDVKLTCCGGRCGSSPVYNTAQMFDAISNHSERSRKLLETEQIDINSLIEKHASKKS